MFKACKKIVRLWCLRVKREGPESGLNPCSDQASVTTITLQGSITGAQARAGLIFSQVSIWPA